MQNVSAKLFFVFCWFQAISKAKNMAYLVCWRSHFVLCHGSKTDICWIVWCHLELEHLQIITIPNMLWSTEARHDIRQINPIFLFFVTILTLSLAETCEVHCYSYEGFLFFKYINFAIKMKSAVSVNLNKFGNVKCGQVNTNFVS